MKSGLKLRGPTGIPSPETTPPGISMRDMTCITPDHNTFNGNNATDNGWEGFYLYNSSSNTFTGNTATNNSHGFYLDASSNTNTLTGNNAISNRDNGYYLRENSTSNNLCGNNATGNTGDGFHILKLRLKQPRKQ